MIQHIPFESGTSVTGNLQIQVTSRLGLIPIENARVTISYSNDPDTVLEQVNTNIVGESETLTLQTPPLDYSLEPDSPQPYSVYNITVEAVMNL